LFNGQAQILLHTSWEKFTHTENLEVGCLLNFLYKGDNELRVNVFDDTSFHTHCHGEKSDDNDDEEKPIV
jgi:hypothetical protein